MIEKEVYKKIIGYENYYEISNYGNVRSTSYKGVRVLKPFKQRNGYLNVILCVDQVKIHKTIHRLVAINFIDNPNNLETVNHIDCNKENNHVSNLEWASMSDNRNHAIENGLLQKYEDRPAAKLTKEKVLDIPRLISLGATTDDLKNYFNVSRRCIDNIFEGKNWKGLGIDFTTIKPNKKLVGIPSKFIIETIPR